MNHNRSGLETILLFAAFLTAQSSSSSTAGEVASREAKAEISPERLVIKVTDAEGAPVAGAKIGRSLEWRHPAEEPHLHSISPELGTLTTDETGQSEIRSAAIDNPERFRLIVISADRRQMAFVQLPKPLPAVYEVTLSPACEVRLKVGSSDLKKLGEPLAPVATHVLWQNRSMAVVTGESGRFLLPPGKYKYASVGSFAAVRDKDLEIKVGVPHINLDVNLPAANYLRLRGKPAPEISKYATWQDVEPVKLADLRGKVIVLAFFDFNYLDIEEAPFKALMELHDKLRPKGLEVIGVSSNFRFLQGIGEARFGLLEESLGRKIPFPLVIDGTGQPPLRLGPTFEEYGIDLGFAMIAIDRDGNVLGVVEPGKKGESMLEAALIPDRS